MKCKIGFCSTLLLLLFLLLLGNPAFAENTVSIEYSLKPNQADKAIKSQIIASGVAKQVTSMINAQLSLKYPLRIVFGDIDGPLYDDETKRIDIPYHFIDQSNQRFENTDPFISSLQAKNASNDALMHTLLHELGHALIPMFAIPVLGKEENTVDNFANVLLIEYFDDGALIAINAAELFYLESQDVENYTDNDFKGEHGLDSQRYYNTLCMVYGSQPEQYQYIKNKAGFSEERAELCGEDYERISRSWLSILEQYRKKP